MAAKTDARLRLIIQAQDQTSSVFKKIASSASEAAKQIQKALEPLNQTGGNKFTQDMTKGVNTLTGSVNGLNHEVKEATKGISSLDKHLGLQNLDEASNKIRNLGVQLGTLLNHGIEDAMDKSRAVAEYVTAMKINTPELANKSQEFVDNWTAEVKKAAEKKSIEVGINTTFSDNQVMQGMAILAKSGLEAEAIMDGVAQQMANIAQIGNTDIPSSAKGMVQIYNTMGSSLKAQFTDAETGIYDVNAAFGEVSDRIAGAMLTSGVSLQQFLNTLKYAGPPAAQAGQSFTELSTTIALLSKYGIEGSVAGTGLRRMLTNLTPDTDDAKAAFEQLGWTVNGTNNIFYDAQGKMKSLTEVQRILFNGLSEANPQQKTAILKEIFGQYALGTSTVMATAEGFDELRQKIEQAGIANEFVGAIMDSSYGKHESLKEAVNSLKETIGQYILDYLDPLKVRLKSLVEDYLALPEPIQKGIAVTLGFIAAGLTLIGTIGSIVATIGMFAAGWSKTMAVIGVANMGFMASMGSFIAIVGAVIAIGYVLYTAWTTNFGGIRDFTQEIWAAILPDIQNAIQVIRDTIMAGVQFITEWWSKMAPHFQQAIANIIAIIKAFTPLWQQVWDGIKNIVSNLWDAMTKIIQGATKIIMGIFEVFTGALTLNGEMFKEGFVKIISGLVDLVVGLFKGMWTMATASWQLGIDALIGLAKSIWSWIQPSLSDLWNSVVNAFQTMWNNASKRVEDGVNSVVDWVRGLPGRAMSAIFGLSTSFGSFFSGLGWDMSNWARNAMDMFVGGITSKIQAVRDAAASAANAVKDFLGFSSPTKAGPASNSDEWFPNMMEMFTEGIEDNRKKLRDAVSAVAMDVRTTIGVDGNGLQVATPASSGARGQTVINVTINSQGKGGDDLAREFVDSVRRYIPVVTT